MKSTKVQTLSAVALHATTACTGDSSIVGLGLVGRSPALAKNGGLGDIAIPGFVPAARILQSNQIAAFKRSPISSQHLKTDTVRRVLAPVRRLALGYTHTHTHTHTHNNYRNPRCACAPRVNNSSGMSLLSLYLLELIYFCKRIIYHHTLSPVGYCLREVETSSISRASILL